MKIFSWMRNKRNGNEAANKQNPDSIPYQTSKEEFSDWPNGLLAIGTFGHSSLKLSSQYHLPNTTPQDSHEEDDDKFFDCLREDEGKNEDTRLQRSTSVVHRGTKDIQFDNNKQRHDIGRKSLSFLIKKALLCSGGFTPTPTLRDPVLPDPNKLDRSRMEKILMAMLHKKIYPQRPSPKTNTSKKYLDMPEADSEQEKYEEGSHESKWVKTDSEYIVLEI